MGRLLFITVLLLLPVLSTAAPPRVRLGGISVNAGYSRWSGYGPGFWGWGPAYGAGFYPFMPLGSFYPVFWGPDKGEIKLKSADRNAEVYIEGAYAGTAGQLKSMWLDPGVYKIEVRGRTTFQKKIYVLTGKALRLEAR